jgi:hypothetical protein
MADSRQRLSMAHRDYAQALARRDAMASSEPGYHEAVLEVGIRWSQVRYWERRAGGEARIMRTGGSGSGPTGA